MLSDMKVLFSASEDMMCIWCKITKGNLKSVEIENGNGVTVARYFDIILISETSIIQSDGNILTNFVLEKTGIEKVKYFRRKNRNAKWRH